MFSIKPSVFQQLNKFQVSLNNLYCRKLLTYVFWFFS